MRQETDAAIIETAARIADLEVRYVAAKHAVTAETAMAFGFVERPERTYVSRATTNLVLNTDYPTDE